MMRSAALLILLLAFCVGFSACATKPRAYHPQPTDHSRVQAKHLYFALTGALAENEREVAAAYLAETVSFLHQDGMLSENTNRDEAIERLENLFCVGAPGKSACAGPPPEEEPQSFSREELLEMGSGSPINTDILRGEFQERDILLMCRLPESANDGTASGSLTTPVFRSVEGRMLLIAVILDGKPAAVTEKQ